MVLALGTTTTTTTNEKKTYSLPGMQRLIKWVVKHSGEIIRITFEIQNPLKRFSFSDEQDVVACVVLLETYKWVYLF